MSGILRTCLWIGVVAGAAGVGWSLRETRFDLMSPERGGVYSYSDRSNGGNSTIVHETGSFGWRAEIRLSPGFAYPYAGMGVKLRKGSRAAVVDARGFDSLVLELRSREQKTVKIDVKAFDPGSTDTLRDLSHLLFEGAVGVDREWSRRSIALRDMSIPLWWFQTNGLDPSPRPDWLRNLTSVDLLNGMESPSDLQDTLEVRRFELVGTRWTPMAISLALALALIGFVEWRLRRGGRSGPDLPNSVAARLVDLQPRQDLEREALLKWIGENYAREEIGVELAGRETGIHPRKVAGILKASVGKTFPAHVNELRLTESARLLRETDRTVSEIAAAVGVGNIPHFHRLFKTRFGTTPKEWRSQGGGREA